MSFAETGYQVFAGAAQLDAILDLDIVTGSLEENVFRDDQGQVKQVQHLEQREAFRKIGEAVMSATGQKGTIVNMQMFIKLPGAKATVPHQDGAYFVQNSSGDHRTIWMPLQAVTEENSCLSYVPVSHKWGLVEHRESGQTTRTRTGVTGRSIQVDIDKQKHGFVDGFVAVPMAAGDAVMHHPMTVHRSSANRTDATRRALTCIVAL